MPARLLWTRKDDLEARRLYESGLTVTETAAHFGRSSGGVIRALYRAGSRPRTKSECRTGKPAPYLRALPADRERALVRAYRKGTGPKELSQRFGVSIACVFRALKRAGASRRGKTKFKDLTGKTFGWLQVLRFDGHRPHKKPHYRRTRWRCRCVCGKEVVVDGGNLRSGASESCGCNNGIRGCNRTHGLSASREYKIWRGIKDRCENPRCKAYPRYGGRGIRVCERWKSFEAFFADMGKRPSGRSLDRVDNDGPYSPENCRWATPTQQARNQRTNRRVTFLGVTLTVPEWAEITGLNYHTLFNRLNTLRWTVKDALTVPVKAPMGASPEIREAGTAVMVAVRTGKLPRVGTLTCVRCGDGANQYHHHKGYAYHNRLEVIPVCARCHEIAHHWPDERFGAYQSQPLLS